jgi:hypothetical protein
MSVGQITFETQGWIEQADLVVYCVADPATEDWIRRHSKDSRDLYALYGNHKPRIDTYNDMIDEMVMPVREGKTVCGVFYGHPGVFVHPGHKAIGILRAEGYRAQMLPGISALDTLFADLGVDPSVVGCVTYEATDMLLRNRPLIRESHAIVWQIGCVGDFGFNFGGYENRHLRVLVDFLEQAYSPEQIVTHYQGSQYPVCPPQIERLPLAELADARVTGISTLYIPPVQKQPVDREMAVRLGILPAAGPPAPERAAPSEVTSNGAAGAAAVADGRPKPPRRNTYYMPTRQDGNLARYIELLATDPRILAAHRRAPDFASRLYGGLDDEERRAIMSRSGGRIRMAMKNRAPVSSILHAVFDADPDDPDAETLRTVDAVPVS